MTWFYSKKQSKTFLKSVPFRYFSFKSPFCNYGQSVCQGKPQIACVPTVNLVNLPSLDTKFEDEATIAKIYFSNKKTTFVGDFENKNCFVRVFGTIPGDMKSNLIYYIL